MKSEIKKIRRKSIRLSGYDYSSSGIYFVTICTRSRESLLGSISNNKIILSPIGEIARLYWTEIPRHFKQVDLDIFIIMPNHIHGLIKIYSTDEDVGAEHVQPRNAFQHITKGSVGSIIRQYKASVTRWCNQNGHNDFRWQRNFYEHIVRNEKELNKIREYIITNPLRWKFDRNNINSENFNLELDEYYKGIYDNLQKGFNVLNPYNH